MKESMPGAREEVRRLDVLVAHPLQGLYFDDLSESDLKALAADIRRNGLRDKIQILPKNKAGLKENTIIDGHQRRRALLKNGEKSATVIVRHDLADADPAAVERAYLEFNQNRRQLDPLARARVGLRLFEIEKKRPRGRLSAFENGEARDRVGKLIGMTGRNLNRYLRLLQTPVEVQNAFRARELPLVEAERVADLKPAQQADVAERVRAGECPRAVVGSYFPARDGRHVNVNDALVSFCKALVRGVEDLDGRVDRVSERVVERHLADLERARAVIDCLISEASAVQQPAPAGRRARR